MKSFNVQYYVEGKCEKVLLNALKEQKNLILPGKVEVFNVVIKELTDMYLRVLSENTVVVFLFDTDIEKTDILRKNIAKVMESSRVRELWLVIQVKNLEDELLRSTDVRDVKDLIGCKTNKEYKSEFVKEKKLFEKLKNHGFDFTKMWAKAPCKPFDNLCNDGYKIKKLKRKK